MAGYKLLLINCKLLVQMNVIAKTIGLSVDQLLQ